MDETEAIARFGNVPAFVHHLLMTHPGPSHVTPEGDAQARYMVMLDG